MNLINTSNANETREWQMSENYAQISAKIKPKDEIFQAQNVFFKCCDYQILLQDMKERGVSVDCILTDPPYNISRKNNFTTMGRAGIDFGKWDYEFNQKAWIRECVPFLKNGGSIIIFNDWKNLSHICEALEDSGCAIKDLLRWEKTNPMPRNVNSRYVTDFEVAVWAVKGSKKWVFNKPLEKSYLKPSFKAPVITGGSNHRIHPTQKSLNIIKEILSVHTNKNSLVFDPFCGSATTAIACVELNRAFIGSEIDATYFNLAKTRIINALETKNSKIVAKNISLQKNTLQTQKPKLKTDNEKKQTQNLIYTSTQIHAPKTTQTPQKQASLILSPLNYVGNKARILPDILNLFPQGICTFTDIFCGSGIVGLNSNSKSVVLNDNDVRVIELLRYFQQNSIDFILSEIENLIKEFKLTDSKSKPKGFYEIHKNEGLSRHNKKGFLELRNDYNKNPSEIKLFVLILFGFNHFIRFNANGLYNAPVGKSDFSTFQVAKTKAFINTLQSKDITLTSVDFRERFLYESPKNSRSLSKNSEIQRVSEFFYFDPPYLIANAPYNAIWSEKDERDLYEILDALNAKNKLFALSNVLESNGKSSDLLKKWSEKYHINLLKRDYTNANYHRKNLGKSVEVLITNYDKESL